MLVSRDSWGNGLLTILPGRAALLDLYDRAAGDAQELVAGGREHGVRVPAGGPDDLVLCEPLVHERPDRPRVADRGDAADRLAGRGPDELRIRPLHRGGADQLGDL